MMDAKKIHDFIKKQLELKDWTLGRLAAEAGVNVKSLERLAKGETVREKTVSKLLEPLGFQVECNIVPLIDENK